jgi:spermidine/putrescine transport system permease protein
VEQDLPADLRVVAPPPRRPRRRLGKRLAPYLLLLPGGGWLLLFFLVPMAFMASASLMTGDYYRGFNMTWHFANFTDVLTQYHTQFLRSLLYGTAATIGALVVAYPLAYWIAFRGGKYKTTLLFMLLLPFFVSFVIRTLAWQFILSDNGIVFGALKNIHLLPQGFHVLATSTAVIWGIAYNFLPFMALPLYVTLERIDRRVIEAAGDLYASRVQVFRKVILPLSIPGIFAGVLLTFIPAVGDYVNATVLGGTQTTMIGNIIQLAYLQNSQYPQAAAMSFILMFGLLIGMLIYSRVLGARSIEEYV